jgi:hypothetical protein
MKLVVSTRALAIYVDTASWMVDQLQQVGIEATLEQIETGVWHPKMTRLEYQVALNVTGNGIDDPDALLFENYRCGSQRNFSGYCSEEIDRLMTEQSQTLDRAKRLVLVNEIDRRLQSLLGSNVRVFVDYFSPPHWNGELDHVISTRSLVLPDNSQPAVLPVFFEGRLVDFQRQIGVVYAWLEPLCLSDDPAEGIMHFLGKTAVILKAPAAVRLAVPHFLEKLPQDPDNYWRDLQEAHAQFRFCF